MSDSGCKHIKLIQEHVKPSADGCEDCLKVGDSWVHLRLCLICGQVDVVTHQRINMRLNISIQQNILSFNLLNLMRIGNGVMLMIHSYNISWNL
jgi:hypothetical protein